MSEENIHRIFLAAVKVTVQGGIEVPAQITTGIVGGEALRSLVPSFPWANDSKFILLRKTDGRSGSDGKEKTGSEWLVESIAAAESIIEAATIVEAALVRRLAKSLGLADVDVNVEKQLYIWL
ncbi:hypothetical protein IFR04_011037 [Cadophora malorum]|uniref:Uncharacterized protein n=1 Tax=Cadophora malorum TaxID=108018 RepID=A0A8H7TBK3_9HELO|nr:hypothetical protein IFR04_011037 [Cadophora malorum]